MYKDTFVRNSYEMPWARCFILILSNETFVSTVVRIMARLPTSANQASDM